MKTLPSVSTYTSVIAALSHGSGREALAGLATEGYIFIIPLHLHLSSPREVSTFVVGMGERNVNLVYNSDGPAHSLKQ